MTGKAPRTLVFACINVERCKHLPRCHNHTPLVRPNHNYLLYSFKSDASKSACENSDPKMAKDVTIFVILRKHSCQTTTRRQPQNNNDLSFVITHGPRETLNGSQNIQTFLKKTLTSEPLNRRCV